MSEFLKSTKALDDAVRAANNYEAVREAALQHMAADHQIVRSNEGFGQRRIAGEPEPEPDALVSVPTETGMMRKFSDTFCRYVIFDNCHFELFGDSEADLDAQEAKIRAVLSAGRS
jgi:hypothetical protein